MYNYVYYTAASCIWCSKMLLYSTAHSCPGMYIYTCIYMYIHYVYNSVCVMYVYVYVSISVGVHMYNYSCACVHTTCVCVCVCVCVRNHYETGKLCSGVDVEEAVETFNLIERRLLKGRMDIYNAVSGHSNTNCQYSTVYCKHVVNVEQKCSCDVQEVQ